MHNASFSLFKKSHNSVELLKQNLAIEPDLQNFIGFALESVGKLGGNAFSASIASLEVMKNLRSAGAGTGYPLPASLLLQGNQLVVSWGDPAKEAKIAYLQHPPEAALILQLRQHLQDSTE